MLVSARLLPRLSSLLPLGLLLCMLVACSDGGQRQYTVALAELEQLELQVEDGFDAVRAQVGELLAEGAWSDPAALEKRLTDSRQAIDKVVADQRTHMQQERAMLALEAMDNAPKTRELYHLDLAAQEAKLAVFSVYQQMYIDLLAALRDDQPIGYMEQARHYWDLIAAANEHFQDLDRLRQLRQEALFASRTG